MQSVHLRALQNKLNIWHCVLKAPKYEKQKNRVSYTCIAALTEGSDNIFDTTENSQLGCFEFFTLRVNHEEKKQTNKQTNSSLKNKTPNYFLFRFFALCSRLETKM